MGGGDENGRHRPSVYFRGRQRQAPRSIGSWWADEPCDAIVISVKSDDTEWAVALRPRVAAKPNSVVVDFQNGVNDERVAAVAGRERCLSCVITIGAGMYDPGHAARIGARSASRSASTTAR